MLGPWDTENTSPVAQVLLQLLHLSAELENMLSSTQTISYTIPYQFALFN